MRIELNHAYLDIRYMHLPTPPGMNETTLMTITNRFLAVYELKVVLYKLEKWCWQELKKLKAACKSEPTKGF